MKKSSVAVLILAAALAAGTAAKADYYTFTSGTALVLNDTTVSDYVTTNGTINANHKNVADGTKNGATLSVKLYNATAGDYVFTMLGTADGYEAGYTVTIASEDGNYSKSATIVQGNSQNSPNNVNVSNRNLSDSNYRTGCEQMTLMMLESLPQGNLTLTLSISKSSDGWAGNYGFFKFTKVDSISDAAYNITSNSGVDAVIATASGSKTPLAYFDKDQSVLENDGYMVGSNRNGYLFSLVVKVDAEAPFSFSYKYKSGPGQDPNVRWLLSDATGTQKWTANDTGLDTSDNIISSDVRSVGTLSPGYYILKAKVTTSRTWGGNYGYFNFTSYMELPTDGTMTDGTIDLATAKGNGSLVLKGSGGIKISSAGLIDSTKQNDDTFTFYLYSATESAYRFSYKGGTHTATVAWTLDGTEEIATDDFTGTGSTLCNDQRTHNLGAFASGSFHALVGKVVKKASDTNAWGGNYGYFQFIEAATTTIDSATVYVEKSWLATEYGSGMTTVPEGFDSVQEGKAISGAEAYALGYNSIPAAGAVVVSPSITGTTMTFGFKDADVDAAAARGAIVNYTLKTGSAAGSLNDETSSSSLPTLDLATVDSVKYIQLKADVSWAAAN